MRDRSLDEVVDWSTSSRLIQDLELGDAARLPAGADARRKWQRKLDETCLGISALKFPAIRSTPTPRSPRVMTPTSEERSCWPASWGRPWGSRRPDAPELPHLTDRRPISRAAAGCRTFERIAEWQWG